MCQLVSSKLEPILSCQVNEPNHSNIYIQVPHPEQGKLVNLDECNSTRLFYSSIVFAWVNNTHSHIPLNPPDYSAWSLYNEWRLVAVRTFKCNRRGPNRLAVGFFSFFFFAIQKKKSWTKKYHFHWSSHKYIYQEREDLKKTDNNIRNVRSAAHAVIHDR